MQIWKHTNSYEDLTRGRTHTHTHTHARARAHTHTHTRTHRHTHTHTHTLSLSLTHTHAHTHTRTHVCTHAHVWSHASTHSLSLSLSLSIKIVLLKRTSLTDKDYKAAQILPLSSRLMTNKTRCVHKIVSGRAPMYLSRKLLIIQSSRNSSRKLNVPIPRTDLLKSSLVYSGPVLWNSLPSELRFPVSPSVFKKHLTLHMLSLLGVTWNHDHRYFIYIAWSDTVHGCVVYTERAETDSLWQQILVAPAMPAL